MNRRTSNTTIRTRTTLFVVLVIGVLTVLMVTIQFRTSLNRFEEIEDDQALDHIERVVRQLGDSQADLGGTNADWAWWDDSYLFIQDRNQDYRDSNLYYEAFTPLGIELVVYVDNAANVVHQAWYTDDGELPVPAEVLAAVAPAGPLGDFSQDAQATPGGIVTSGPDRFLVTSRALLPSDRDAEPAGVLLMGRHINEVFVSELADLVSLDLVMEACAEQSCATLTAEPTIAKTSNSIAVESVIADIDGNPALRAQVAKSRALYQESLAGLKRVLLILTSVGIAAVIVTLAGLRRLIITPLERLGATIADVARNNDPSLRAVVDRQDEIGEFAAGVNIMLARLENSQRQLQEANDRVEGASEAKSRFLSRVSHELRTPINGVLAYAQLLQLDHPNGESCESIEQIITSAKHITSLVDEFLDIARIEAGAIPIDIDEVNPAEVAAEAIKMTQPLADAQATNVKLVGRTEAMVLADPLRLRQSILNLVSNAIKYGRGDQPITIKIQQSEGNATIEVRDHGPGIPAEQMDRLFVPFDRLGADKSNQKGSGVGLSVTKQLIELMGGTISVTSEVDAGTAFTIRLPAAPTTTQPVAETAVARDMTPTR